MDKNELSTTPLAGTGLGISQRIATKIGSKIQFKSAEGNGSSFWFIIDIDSWCNDSGNL